MPKPDINQTAARVVRSTTDQDKPLPPNVEAAWEAWAAGVGKTDARSLALLRAAFEAGVEAGRSSHAG